MSVRATLRFARANNGIGQTRWPGRFQYVPGQGNRPEIILDVAHNPAGAWALRGALSERFRDRPVYLVFGAMRDKPIDAVAAAGKSAYPLPMYANAALIRPNYQPGQYNSGGPLPHSIDIYRAGAPHLDFLSPDIYFDNFAEWVSRYHRDGNAVFVPEAKGGVSLPFLPCFPWVWCSSKAS